MNTHTSAPPSLNMPASETIELLRNLVSFNTVSRESNLGLIEWVRDYLRRFGADTHLTYDAQRRKANLFATLGDGAGAGMVFSGHTDVVPVDGQSWDGDPFSLRIADGKAYGRGTCDMKGFIAVCLSKAPALAMAGSGAPVHFAFSYDEEVGCLGVRGLLADLAERDIRPAGCIVGEPTSMVPAIAHKGKRAYRCCVKGHASHSSAPLEGVNAVEFAAELIVHARKLAQRMRQPALQNHEFGVPFSSMVTTVIQGGRSVNTIPEHCEFVFEYRFLPGVDPDLVIGELQAYARDVLAPQMNCPPLHGAIEFELLTAYPGLDAKIGDAVVALAMRLLRSDRAVKVGFGSEAGLFSEAGIPTLICGPGDIANAHKPNEYVALAQLAQCEAFFDAYTGNARRNLP